MRLSIDGEVVGSIELPSYLSLGISASEHRILCWAGANAWVFDLNTKILDGFTLNDEIFACYPVTEDRWCLICETCIALWDAFSKSVLSRYELDEVVVNHWWTDERLDIEDFQGRSYAFDVEGDDLKLV